MNRTRLVQIVLPFTIVAFAASFAAAGPGPSDGKNFQGRIAYSADGNHNDPDDWSASPVALAIIARAGFKDRLVHFDYNCILPETHPDWEKKHADGVLGAAERYGYDRSLFFDCRQDVDAATDDIAAAINASSAEDPLYFIIAGPMEVPYLGIEKSNPAKRRFVYCISHSRWNDGFANDYTFTHTKRSVIPQGVKWIQIPDQNATLAFSRYGTPARPEEFEPYFWMRDSHDARLNFLWERTVVSTRPDCSDAGMAWFVVTGDEHCEIPELRALLEAGKLPPPADPRPRVRLEAECFLHLDGYELEHKNDRNVSHRINVKLNGAAEGAIRTPFLEPYTALAGRYDIEVRYLDEQGQPFSMSLGINGRAQGRRWESPGTERGWTTQTIRDVPIRAGDEIAVTVQSAEGTESAARLDFVQLNYLGPESSTNDRATNEGAVLDDPDALPGQIIVAGDRPGHLKYNGGGPAFLCGPDNPEDFLFRGRLEPDGTRSGGGQEEMIERLATAGLNAFHCQMFRMQRCNFKDEGDDTHCPFVDHDPAKGLDEDVLDLWDGWLSRFEEHGINVHLEFYNDATDVERMGWTLDSAGNLPVDEQSWIAGIVERFQHHKNVLWGIEESCNKLPNERTAHFKKIAELIATTDDHHHPIVQSFVVPNDPEGDFPADGITPDEYIADPHVRVVTWLHVVPHGDDIELQHAEYSHYHDRDAGNFVVMKNETFHHPKHAALSRRYMWSCAMTGMHCLEAYHHADDTPERVLRQDGYINRFMERTAFHAMQPHDELAAGSTRWVLAAPGESYIAYTYDYDGAMGIEGIPDGAYELRWLDTADGDEVTERVDIASSAEGEQGVATFSKPESFGAEVALSITLVKLAGRHVRAPE